MTDFWLGFIVGALVVAVIGGTAFAIFIDRMLGEKNDVPGEDDRPHGDIPNIDASWGGR